MQRRTIEIAELYGFSMTRHGVLNSGISEISENGSGPGFNIRFLARDGTYSNKPTEYSHDIRSAIKIASEGFEYESYKLHS